MENKLLGVISSKLSISDSHSVQPNVLLRTSVFIPSSTKSISKVMQQDVTEDLRHLELFRREGYEYIKIVGNSLNVRTDFKIWCGVVLSFSKYGYDTDEITMSLREFIRFCGFSSNMLNKVFRERIESSLKRIMGVRIDMGTREGKKASTLLLSKFKFDPEKDEIQLKGDPELWELYRIDKNILVNLKTIEAMPRAENAQCLYLFFASLPKDPIPVTLSRLRERMASQGAIKDINNRIKKAITKLEELKYLKGYWIKFQGENAYVIESRAKALPAKIVR